MSEQPTSTLGERLKEDYKHALHEAEYDALFGDDIAAANTLRTFINEEANYNEHDLGQAEHLNPREREAAAAAIEDRRKAVGYLVPGLGGVRVEGKQAIDKFRVRAREKIVKLVLSGDTDGLIRHYGEEKGEEALAMYKDWAAHLVLGTKASRPSF